MTATGQVVAPSRRSGRWRRLTVPLGTVGALAAGTAALHVRDPHQSGTWGFCPSQVLFGVSCPGCGGLRAVNDLTNLDLLAAASSNLLFIASLPVVVWVVVGWLLGAWRGEPYRPRWAGSRALYAGSVSLVVVFTVLRNTPVGSWLAP